MQDLGPFRTGTNPLGDPMGHLDSESRIAAVRDFDRDQCIQALAMVNVQSSVRKAVYARIRKLNKLEREKR